MKYEPKLEKEIMCPIEYGLEIFGGKWKSRIICVLSAKPVMRYNEIRKELGNITDAVLAAMLKELIENDMIDRRQYNEIPPRVEYALTEIGKSSLPILQSICAWSRTHTKENLNKKLPSCKTCPQLHK
ncbi:winged helix-turn-helix transcriptional regulator [Desulforamulus ruminis]|uniref:Helix-turn-helix HxlR type n=1 Tax=Desulforamulus ruminis (strain ATCC 23193 / DSM 2154 / NCIMB 8452 / DL) TaxID=696281 RepID=F6DUL5_DESRL|nr:helix-turn-helix domain-containing protein [Desulforamulus ruminis]AEG59082.1 helix-turn-helix HxlR type [Desulforamulus ruminis DSM 2154]